MRKKTNILILFVITALILLQACKSPMEIDSPTDDGEPIVKYRIIPDMPDMDFDENGELRYFTVGKTSASIDTLSDIPYVWLDLVFEADRNFSNAEDSLCISQFSIKLDSLPIIPFIEDTLDNPETRSWSSFIIETSGITSDTLISGKNRNLTRVSFSFDKSGKEMKAFIYTRLIKKQSSDTSYFRATLTFRY